MTKTQLQPKQRIEAYQKVWEAFDKEAENLISDLEDDISHRQSWRMVDREKDIEQLLEERKIAEDRYNEYVKVGQDKAAKEWYNKIVEADNKILDKRKEQFEKFIQSIENKMEDSAILGWEPGTSKIGYLQQLLNEALIKQDWDTLEQQEETIRQRRNALLQEARTEMQWFYNEWKDEQNQITERIKAQKSIWSGYYETSNNLLEAQHNINKELQKSLTSMQYLDEDTRKLLFNTEDYAALTKEINKLQTQATKLRKDYLEKIEGKTKEEVSLITQEYERQNKLLQKQYEIAKKQLEVDKARMELNNVLNERNTRMFIGGQWQWVANSEAIIQAQEKLANAEYAVQKAQLDRDQQAYLNSFDESVADITKVLNDMEEEWKRIDKELAGHAQNMLDVFARLPQQVQELMSNIYNVVGLEGGSATIPTKTLTPANPVDESIPYGYGKNTLSTLGKTVEIAGTATLDTTKLVNSQVNANYRFSQQQIAEKTLKAMGSSSTTDNRITINGFTISGDTSDGEALRSILTRVIGNR